ncbi:MAG: sugar phosphate isomerase/epimerase [Lachnospiraceae bacterium]|nr:sugar phosphate isomerase/epimerase [Lachnospiraceae bacterium]
MMRIGLRLHDSRVCPLPERLRNIREQGFCCVHIALGKTEGLPKEPEALTPGYAMWLKEQFSVAGLDMAVLGNYKCIAEPDALEAERVLYTYRAHLRFASLCGCGMVGTESPLNEKRVAPDKLRETSRSEEAYRCFVNRLKSVVSDAERFGVILAVEPVYKHIIYDPKRARRMLDEIASPNLQIIFDPVNLIDPERLEAREEVIAEAMELLAPEIAMIHLKDYVIEGGKMKAVGCGFGEMDYREIVRFAETKKPYIHATLENTTPDTAEHSRRLIEELAAVSA